MNQHGRCLLILLLCFFSIAGLYAGPKTEWHLVGTINTPAAILKEIAAIEDVKPIYEACRQNVDKLFHSEALKKIEKYNLDETVFFAYGSVGEKSRSRFYVWTGDAKQPKFLRVCDSPFEILPFTDMPADYGRESGTKESVAFPQELSSFPADALFGLKFLQQASLEELKNDLEAELKLDKKIDERKCKENMRKLSRMMRKGQIKSIAEAEEIKCPLDGKYSLNDADKSVSCSHVVKIPDYRSIKLEGAAKRALEIINILENIDEISAHAIKDSGKFELLLKHRQQKPISVQISSDIFPAFAWVENLAEFDRLSPDASFHMVVNPDIVDYYQKVSAARAKYSNHRPAALSQFEELLPRGPMLLSMVKNFNLMSAQMPDGMLSLGISPEKHDMVKKAMQEQGVPLAFSRHEIYGRDVEMVEMPDMGRGFNTIGETDNRIFVVPDGEKRTMLCFGEHSAKRQLAMENGEKRALSLWSDVKRPVKFAMAHRFETLLHSVLKLANQTMFMNELRLCEHNLMEWRQKNREAATALKMGDAMPAGLRACCPRNAILLGEKPGQVMCAVHSYQTMGKIEAQFLSASVSSDRWIRFYVLKEDGQSRFVIDFTSGREVK